MRCYSQFVVGFLGAVSVWGVVHPFCKGRSHFSARSQSVHAERELVGWQDKINLCVDDACEGYSSFSVQPGYARSFRSSDIADYFFGTDCLTFSGSRVDYRGDKDLLADYFGLPTGFKSVVQFTPVVQDFFIDFNFFNGLDALWQGTYIRIHCPFVHTRWDMGIKECVQEMGEEGHIAGYFSSGELSRGQHVDDVTSWFKGKKAVGDLQPLQFGRINGTCSRTGISDIQVALGWNPILSENYHFGFNVRTSIPAGSKSRGTYLFEPIVGNGHHWEFGVGFTGHATIWEDESSDHAWFVYGDANITHLFSACHMRSFDFKKNDIGSRYITIQEIGTPIVEGLLVDGVPAEHQYHGKLMPAINKTTLLVDVDVAVQADVVLKFAYRYKEYMSFDFGYNVWGRTQENFNCRQCFPENCFAVKGDAQVYGFGEVNQSFIGLNATQSTATIRSGQGDGNSNFTNLNADNAFKATFLTDAADDDAAGLNQVVSGNSLNLAKSDVNGSKQSILLMDEDIDNLSGLAPSALSHTLFAHFQYRWTDTECIEPSIGCGFEISFDGSDEKNKSALSQWGLWVKFGLSV